MYDVCMVKLVLFFRSFSLFCFLKGVGSLYFFYMIGNTLNITDNQVVRIFF